MEIFIYSLIAFAFFVVGTFLIIAMPDNVEKRIKLFFSDLLGFVFVLIWFVFWGVVLSGAVYYFLQFMSYVKGL